MTDLLSAQCSSIIRTETIIVRVRDTDCIQQPDRRNRAQNGSDERGKKEGQGQRKVKIKSSKVALVEFSSNLDPARPPAITDKCKSILTVLQQFSSPLSALPLTITLLSPLPSFPCY